MIPSKGGGVPATALQRGPPPKATALNPERLINIVYIFCHDIIGHVGLCLMVKKCRASSKCPMFKIQLLTTSK